MCLKKISAASILIVLFLFVFCISIQAQTNSFQYRLSSGLTTAFPNQDGMNYGVDCLFSLKKINSASGVPLDELPFLNRIPTTYAGLTEDVSEKDGTGTFVNWSFRFANRKLPFSAYLLFQYGRHKWGDTDALLQYFSIGIKPGYYLTDNVEISAKFQYYGPHLFSYASSFEYSYLAWDIFELNGEVKYVKKISDNLWLNAVGTFLHFKDQQGNSLIGGAFSADLYFNQSFKAGLNFSSTTFNEAEEMWSSWLKALGVTQVGLSGQWNYTDRYGIDVAISRLIPEDDSVDGCTILCIALIARI